MLRKSFKNMLLNLLVKPTKGLRKGGKTNLDMKKYGRGMAKIMNQRSSGRGR
jgi:hypothetical protein